MIRKNPISSSVQPLPNNFAEQILRLEISVEVTNSLESLRSLLELYSQAIEFYESVRDPKYKYYQDRMATLFQKQNTLLLSIQEPKHRPSVSHELYQHREAEKTLKQHSIAAQSASRQVSINLHSQDTSMLTRISRRRLRNTSAEPKSPKIKKNGPFLKSSHKRRSSEGESDKSGGVNVSKEAEEFEKELEEIMEKSVMEKIERTQEIKRKYREEIEEIQKMKGGVMEKLVGELQRAMQMELDELEIELEEKRKVGIRKIREFIEKGK